MIELVKRDTVGCASPDGVFISESQIAKQLVKSYPDKSINDWEDDFPSRMELLNVVSNILRHEYGHILHGHVFMKTPKDKKSLKALIYTNEIETNRGVTSNISQWFKDTALTDWKDPFTPTRTFISHSAIYKKVVEILDNEENNGGDDSGDGNSGDNSDKGNKDSNKSKNFEEPKDDVLQKTSSSTCESQEDALDKLSDELGLSPSSDLTSEGKDAEQRLDIISKKLSEKTIKKSLERIKGHLKGDICKAKVSTYSRQSRRQGEDGLMKCGEKRGKTTAPRVLVALDMSGSMDTVSVKNATVAIKCILDTLGRNRTHADICLFDTCVREFGHTRDWERIVSKYSPGGGTSFSNVMDKAIDIKADVVLSVGDGECYLQKRSLLNKNVDKCPRWVDVIIKHSPTEADYVKQRYIQSDDEIDREVLWLGDDARLIARLLGSYT